MHLPAYDVASKCLYYEILSIPIDRAFQALQADIVI